MNNALMPIPRQQFSDANGRPLAGGLLFSYAAGTTTPLVTYQDANGAAANTNPVVLDAGGFASVWLTASTYKLVLQDLNGVVQWTQDNVSAVSLAELLSNNSFTSLSVSGGVTVGGDETVSGGVTAASLTTTGVATIGGNLTASTAAISGNASVGATLTAALASITGNETVGGTLAVTGATALSTLTVGGTDINALIASAIPALTVLAGTLVLTNVASVGNWVVFTFGGTAGTRVRVAFGAGSGVASGGVITLPSGFSTSNLITMAAIGTVAATSGNQLSQFACSVTAGVITVTASDNSGHNFTPTANWFGCCWLTGY